MREFHLEIDTPNEIVFDGNAQAITIHTATGPVTVYAGHQTMLAEVMQGELIVKSGNDQNVYLTTGGFAEIANDQVKVFTTAAELGNEERTRNDDETKKAVEALRRKKSVLDHYHTKIELTRALSRLRKKNSKNL